ADQLCYPMPRQADLARELPAGVAGGLAQDARQPEDDPPLLHMEGGHRQRAILPSESRPQRGHDASSTIQLRRSPNEMPACSAMSGTSEVGVMPGWVLISSQTTSPSSPLRSS